MDKKQKSSNRSFFNRRPLMQNKSLYNRVIKSMVTHELEDCPSIEVLSKTLTKLVYKSNTSVQRIKSMHKMLLQYNLKIKNDCKILKLEPTSEFDPPESIAEKKKIFVKLDEYQDVIKSDIDKTSIVSQEILEDIGKKVWEVKINPNCNIDKYNQLKNYADEWTTKQKIEKNNSFNETNNLNKCKSSVDDDDDKSMPVLEAFWRPQDIFSKKSKSVRKTDGKKLVRRKLTYEKYLSKSILSLVDIPPLSKPTSTTTGNLIFNDKSDIYLIDKLICDVIIHIKKYNLNNQKQDTEIIHQLESYLHSIRDENLS